MPSNRFLPVLLCLLTCMTVVATGEAEAQQEQLVTGRNITSPPLGTQQEVGSLPVNLILSPDGKYAIISDMGFHQSLYAISTATGTVASSVDFSNSPKDPTNGLYYGLAFGPDGTLYAAQGAHDHIARLKLDANGALHINDPIATATGDFPAGLATDRDGKLYVANNDPGTFAKPTSLSIYQRGVEIGRYTFSSSFNGTPNFPLAIAALADGSRVYVASQRDSAVYLLDTHQPSSPVLLKTIPTGSHPVSLLLNRSQSLLYVANAHSDTVSVISTANDEVRTLLVRAPRLSQLAGASPVGLGLAPDGHTLYIALGDMNALAVATVSGPDIVLKGYIPTGWYPSGVVVSPNGKHLLFTNAKGTTSRYPNPGYVHDKSDKSDENPSYGLNLIRGNVSFVPVPSAHALAGFTKMVLANNGLNESVRGGEKLPYDHMLDTLGLKSGKLKHVIYIVKENRTYDQVLGDLPEGNGNSHLALFGSSITPNLHALARRFVLLDNFYDVGEGSGDGWPWSTQGMANEYVIKNLPYHYSDRGRRYDFEGQNNNYLTGGHPATDPDGHTMSVEFPNGAPPVPDVAEAPGGHIWDAVRKAGLSYRNYGFFYSFGKDGPKGPIIPDNYPSVANLQPAGRDLHGISDWDFRRYDGDYPDSDAPAKYGCLYGRTSYGHSKAASRFQEWFREFQLMLTSDPTGNSVPAFMTVRLPQDHTQGFSPEKFAPTAEVADNDYAVGQLVEAISNSPIWLSTAIFIVEDDAQDGPDHVDSHRSIAFVISPWIRTHSVDHTFYNTDSVLKTMEVLLGLGPMTQYDAIARPISDWDTQSKNDAPYAAILPEKEVICQRTPALSQLKKSDPMRKLVAQSARFDFVHPDSAPTAELNAILWKGIKGARTPMPQPKVVLTPNHAD